VKQNPRSRYKVDDDGNFSLADGWIPTEESMIAFITSIRKDRPNLKRFNFAISVNCDRFLYRLGEDIDGYKRIFEFDYTAPDKLQSQGDEGDGPPDTIAPDLQNPPPEPEYRTIVDHSTIRALYLNMLHLERTKSPESDFDYAF
jgi:hypothetical protein